MNIKRQEEQANFGVILKMFFAVVFSLVYIPYFLAYCFSMISLGSVLSFHEIGYLTLFMVVGMVVFIPSTTLIMRETRNPNFNFFKRETWKKVPLF